GAGGTGIGPPGRPGDPGRAAAPHRPPRPGHGARGTAHLRPAERTGEPPPGRLRRLPERAGQAPRRGVREVPGPGGASEHARRPAQRRGTADVGLRPGADVPAGGDAHGRAVHGPGTEHGGHRALQRAGHRRQRDRGAHGGAERRRRAGGRRRRGGGDPRGGRLPGVRPRRPGRRRGRPRVPRRVGTRRRARRGYAVNQGLIPAKWAALTPDRQAVYDVPNNRRMTWRAFDELVRRLANGLTSLGLVPGDRVAVLSRNCAEYQALYFAAGRAGLVLQPLNWRLAAPELATIVRDGEPKVLISTAEWSEPVTYLQREVDLPHWLQFGPGGDGSLERLVEAASDEEPAYADKVRDEDPFFIL